MKKNTNNEIASLTVGKCFVRVCKNHENFYDLFRRRAANGKNFNCRLKTPFDSNCNDIFEMFKINGEHSDGRDYSQDGKYSNVTCMVNQLLHYYLEGSGVHPERLCKIGQEVFNLSCYALYGNEFLEDLKREQQNAPKDIKSEYDAFCYQQYMMHKNGAGRGMNFDEFKNNFGSQLKSIFNKVKNKEENGND